MFWRSWFSSRRDEKWALASDQEGWFLDDLSFSQVQVVLETLEARSKGALLLWRESDPVWKSYFERQNQEPLPSRVLIRSVAPAPPSFGASPEITSVVKMEPNFVRKKALIPRKSHRYEFVRPVSIQSLTQEFSTVSVDLSEGGIRVRDSLPSWLAGYCTVKIEVSPGVELELNASLAEDQMSDKIRLEFVANEKLGVFHDWFRSRSEFKKIV